MKLDISIVRETLIPLSRYPHISQDEPICNAIALLLAHQSDEGNHLNFEDMLVTDAEGRLVGQLRFSAILEKFFQPALRPSASKHVFEDSEHFAELIVVIDEWLKDQCRTQAAVSVNRFMDHQPLVVSGSDHVVHALGIMLSHQKNVLPVTENNVLKGAIRIEDIFKILGNCCFSSFGATDRIFTEGYLS